MVTDRDAAINLKISRTLRDRLLVKLRARGTTMRAFLGDMIELVDADDAFLDIVEMKRMALGKARTRHIVAPQQKEITQHDLVSSREN